MRRVFRIRRPADDIEPQRWLSLRTINAFGLTASGEANRSRFSYKRSSNLIFARCRYQTWTISRI